MKETYGGIYYLKFKDRYYVGKDSKVTLDKRKREHFNLLRQNRHYNSKLQEAFNILGEKNLEYGIITASPDYSLDELERLEIKYIEEYDAYTKGYNLTRGGYGMNGYILSPTERQHRSDRTYGERNVMSKLSDTQFYEIVEMFKNGKENREVAIQYGLHERYVSLIRHKKRFNRLWETVEDYIPEISCGNDRAKSVTPEAFVEIVYKLKSGATNASIEREYGLSSGTGSRIRNKKLYKNYWKRYFNE
ncbi:nuclease [Paenibacillus sp. CMM36]